MDGLPQRGVPLSLGPGLPLLGMPVANVASSPRPQTLVPGFVSAPEPAHWDWTTFSYSSGFGGGAALLAAVIAFVAALRNANATEQAQKIAADANERRALSERAHFAAGIRRQMIAMTRMVGTHVKLCYQSGTVLTSFWEPTYTLLRTNALKPDVAANLSDDLVASLYDILGSLEIALGVAKEHEIRWKFEDRQALQQQRREFPQLVPKDDPPELIWSERRTKMMKGLFHQPCVALRDFWTSVGDKDEAKTFDQVLAPGSAV